MDDSLARLLKRSDPASPAGSPNPPECDAPRGRFADRTKRLARRQESDVFRVYLMPIAWIVALAGLLGLAVLWFGKGGEAMTSSPVFPVFATLFTAPALTTLLRMVRGHFHPAVREL